jgi:2-C-methyl-D-erythritol 4-phosphate cytidylyltransferase/2-C-methyl-D-erythritol 2,4-cyclodiphosphate synthase
MPAERLSDLDAAPARATAGPALGRVVAVVVAGGRGTRAASSTGDTPKQYRTIGGRAVIAETIARLLRHPAIDHVLPVIHADDAPAFAAAVATDDRLAAPVRGGPTRQDSVRFGLEALAADPPDFVLVHDAVRPFVSVAVIDRVLAALASNDGAIASLPVTDTVKRADGTRRITSTIPRDGLWTAQTPQGFGYLALRDAHRKAAEAGRTDLTDDAAVAEWAGLSVVLVEGEPANIKLTTAADLADADARLTVAALADLPDVRVGQGYDVHAFGPGDAVTLGGIAIPHDRGLVGHSDADVGLHALTDALLGAIADGDIGAHFPPSDPQWKGADSAQFLAAAVQLVRARGGLVAHLDLTVVCEAPKIGPHREAMRMRIAAICGLAPDRVAVKATTSERLGFTGRREGIAALATATVRLPLERWEGV